MAASLALCPRKIFGAVWRRSGSAQLVKQADLGKYKLPGIIPGSFFIKYYFVVFF